ncbi:MAG TPA: ADP-ribosylglycohydrolase family protein [Steroidobacteraceae bacterium]|nr:ADP-ribosylglycohydrolase family protein [Steroidobacteraceae bacterium]
MYHSVRMDFDSPGISQFPPTPIANSYWVIPGRLLAGEYPGSSSRSEAMTKLQRLLAAGVTSFIDLTEDHELPGYDRLFVDLTEQPLRHRRLSITDHSIPESAARMGQILDALQEELSAGRCVYVHCRAGIGRTGTTIACHLIRSGLSNEAALERLQVLWKACGRSMQWPFVPETQEQIDFVREWREAKLGSALLAGTQRKEGSLLGLAVAEAVALRATEGPASGAIVLGANAAMTVSVAESLLALGQHDPRDQLQRYLEWTRSTAPARIPPELKRALGAWQWSRKPNAGSHDPRNLDPHSLARTLAVVLFAGENADEAVHLAPEVSRTTQQSPVVLDLCRFWSALLSDAMSGHDRAQLSQLRTPALTKLRTRNLKPAVRAIFDHATGSMELTADAVGVTMFALRAFAGTVNFRGAVDKVLAHAHPSPTAAALCGALAGAHYGVDALPREWNSMLAEHTQIAMVARRFG